MSGTFDASVRRSLRELEEAGLLRSPREVTRSRGPLLEIDGREVLGLCSNDYLGLADDPRLVEMLRRTATEAGLGSGASRHISGNRAAHRSLERRLAEFVGSPQALVFSSGYSANVGVLQSLAGRGDGIFSDAFNHASIIDGCRLSRAETLVYPHLDCAALGDALATHRTRFDTAFVVTETLFSMDGDRADLKRLAELCAEYDAALIVDEAHALGVLGAGGRGLCALMGVVPDLLIGTLGKAFGCFGAFAAGPAESVRLVENRARSFVFSTAPPPALAAAAEAATDLVEAADAERERLMAHAKRLSRGLRGLGLDVPELDGPILPVLLGTPERAMRASHDLLQLGVFVHGIRPPTVPAGTSRLRVTVSAAHSDADIDRALQAFSSVVS